MYYGDEIGMKDVPIPRQLIQDPFERNVPGLGCGRDPERTPMQWEPSAGAGFTAGMPWLPLSSDWTQVNVAAQAEAPQSILSLYRRLMALRRAEPALAIGAYVPLHAEGKVIAYLREGFGRRFLVVLNLAGAPASLGMPAGQRARLILTTYLDRDGLESANPLQLRPDEGVILDLSQ